MLISLALALVGATGLLHLGSAAPPVGAASSGFFTHSGLPGEPQMATATPTFALLDEGDRSPVDAVQRDDTPDRAIAIALLPASPTPTTGQQRNFDQAGDQDWVRFIITQTNRLVDVRAFKLSAGTDTILSAYRRIAAGPPQVGVSLALIGANDDAPSTLRLGYGSAVTFNTSDYPAIDGQYFAVANSLDPGLYAGAVVDGIVLCPVCSYHLAVLLSEAGAVLPSSTPTPMPTSTPTPTPPMPANTPTPTRTSTAPLPNTRTATATPTFTPTVDPRLTLTPTPALAWVYKERMPTERFGAGVTAGADGRIYVMGADLNLGTVEAYDPLADAWESRADLPTPRRYLSAVNARNGKIYAIGGNSSGTPLDTVEEYDPVANIWTTRASLMTPRAGHGAAMASNGKIYVVGGHGSHGNLSTVEEYDPQSNTWTSRADLPTPRQYLGVVAASNGKIYAIGGIAASGDSNIVEEYDPLTNTWTTRASLPRTRSQLGVAATSNGRVYAIGGYDSTGESARVEEYDVTADRWGRQTSLLTARVNPGVAVLDGRIFVLGGRTGLVTLGTVEEGFFPTSTLIPIALHAGWNLVSLPITTTPPLTASGLVGAAQQQGVTIEMVVRWQEGAWQTYLAGFPANDFPIEQLRGYFVRSPSGGRFILRGKLIVPDVQ